MQGDDIHGTVLWNELMTRDVPGAVAFYEAVCGWRFRPVAAAEGPYLVAHSMDAPVAGIFDMEPLHHLDGVPAHWFTYLGVDDLDAAIEEAVAAGGVVQRAPFPIPNVGRVAIVADPSGAGVGMVQPV